MIIREANYKDCEAICKISNNDLGYKCSSELVAHRLKSLDCKNEIVFVAEINNITIGYIHAEIYNLLYCESMVNILGIAVSSEYRRNGAGTALLRAVENWAKASQINTIRLNSGATRKDAHIFYRAQGYNNEKNQIRFLKHLD